MRSALHLWEKPQEPLICSLDVNVSSAFFVYGVKIYDSIDWCVVTLTHTGISAFGHSTTK